VIKPGDAQNTDRRRSQATSLLNREAPPDYISEWTAHVAAENKSVKADTRSVVVFRIDNERLALSTDSLQEVMDRYTIRTLPDRRGGIVRGLINVRGELMLCIALETLLGMERVEARNPKDRLLIFRRGNFAIEVNEVFGVHRYHPDELRPAPATLRKGSSRSHTIGILRWETKTVAVLDHELLLRTLNKGLL
jgi:chemotaxis-related protein WspD